MKSRVEEVLSYLVILIIIVIFILIALKFINANNRVDKIEIQYNKIPFIDAKTISVDDKYVYCLSSSCSTIMAFDFKGENIFNIRLPYRKNGEDTIYNYNGTICILTKRCDIYQIEDGNIKTEIYENIDNSNIKVIYKNKEIIIPISPEKYSPLYFDGTSLFLYDENNIYKYKNKLELVKENVSAEEMQFKNNMSIRNENIYCELKGFKQKMLIKNDNNVIEIKSTFFEWIQYSNHPIMIMIAFLVVALIIQKVVNKL